MRWPWHGAMLNWVNCFLVERLQRLQRAAKCAGCGFKDAVSLVICVRRRPWLLWKSFNKKQERGGFAVPCPEFTLGLFLFFIKKEKKEQDNSYFLLPWCKRNNPDGYRDQGCREISRRPLLTTITRNPFRVAENYSNFLKQIAALLINLKVHKRNMEEMLWF